MTTATTTTPATITSTCEATVDELEWKRMQAKYPMIPPDTLKGLLLWRDGKHPYPFGSFVTAVLSNNLVEAAAQADDHNRTALWEYANFMYNELPQSAWGSRAKVAAWLEAQITEAVADYDLAVAKACGCAPTVDA